MTKVKLGLEKEYSDYVQKNSDPYGHAVILAGESVMKLLDEGKSVEEAEKGMHGHELTGFMVGCVAQAVVHFHDRGEEFRKFWNKQYQEGEVEGVINPAIMTIG